jgi:hypothetical protein
MSRIDKFEDIEAWKKGRELAKAIYAVTGKGQFARDYGLPRETHGKGLISRDDRNQVRRPQGRTQELRT